MKRIGGGSLVIATHNAGKLREIQALLAPYGVQCISAGALGLPEPIESGTTFAANALIKARAAAEASGLPALADDSGLCVDALGGAPGVYTADWAEVGRHEGAPGAAPGSRDWYLAMGKVEGRLAQLGPFAPRGAQFVCVLAIAWPDGDHAVYEGKVEGELTWPPRGKLGFGYDPVFVPAQKIQGGGDMTFAEIEPERKHAISHRADAFAKLVMEQFGV